MSVDARLRGPLSMITELAVRKAPYKQDPQLDLFSFQRLFYPNSTSVDEIVQYLRREVERLTSGERTVRRVSNDCLARPRPLGIAGINLVVCAANKPEGVIAVVAPDMFGFRVSASSSGYMPLELIK